MGQKFLIQWTSWHKTDFIGPKVNQKYTWNDIKQISLKMDQSGLKWTKKEQSGPK